MAINTSQFAILMIEPNSPKSIEPVIDSLTRKMTAAWQSRRDSNFAYRGRHTCKCGATSDNRDHWVTTEDGRELLTNSLAIHYLAYHRSDVPQSELDKVALLTHGEIVPTKDEMNGKMVKY